MRLGEGIPRPQVSKPIASRGQYGHITAEGHRVARHVDDHARPERHDSIERGLTGSGPRWIQDHAIRARAVACCKPPANVAAMHVHPVSRSERPTSRRNRVFVGLDGVDRPDRPDPNRQSRGNRAGSAIKIPPSLTLARTTELQDGIHDGRNEGPLGLPETIQRYVEAEIAAIDLESMVQSPLRGTDSGIGTCSIGCGHHLKVGLRCGCDVGIDLRKCHLGRLQHGWLGDHTTIGRHDGGAAISVHSRNQAAVRKAKNREPHS